MLYPIRSSNLRAVGYDRLRHVLTVQFHGGEIYDYFRVPESVYAGLLAYQPHPWTAMRRIVMRYPSRRRGRAA